MRNFLIRAAPGIVRGQRDARAHISLAQALDISLNDWMTRGGDARIVLDPATGLNRYSSAPFPSEVLAFASSTANDLSHDADAWLRVQFPYGAAHLLDGRAYAAHLGGLRDTIRKAYGLGDDISVFFAPSGTDLEYVGLLAVAGRKRGGVANLLLGADEVGSGCPLSAAGQFFADETALDVAVTPNQPVAGLPPVHFDDVPVRCATGEANASGELAHAFAAAIGVALSQDRFPLVHVVHGSKTGLVLPSLADVDVLRDQFGEQVGFVVDACQARITGKAIADYLARGIVVFVTGSKFMGGPPFSGFALLPPGLAASAAPIAPGMAQIFRRAEIPGNWPGREVCEDTGNPGLALRLSASLFELERFQALPFARVARVVEAFTAATDGLAARLGVRKVATGEQASSDHPIEMRTLATLDLCHDADGKLRRDLTFDQATQIHRDLIAQGIRLGQPVRCVRLPDGEWGATLRIGLSMPQVCLLDALADGALDQWLAERMQRLCGTLAAQLLAGAA